MILRHSFLLSLLLLLMGSGCGRSGVIEVVKGLKMNTQIVDDANRGLGYDPDFTLDRNFTPIIAYYDQVNGDLKFARLNRSTGFWDVEVVDSEGDVGLYPNIGLDREGNPWILYMDNSRGALKLARQREGVWSLSDPILIPDYAVYGFIRAQKDENEGIHASLVAQNLASGSYDVFYVFLDLNRPQSFTGTPVTTNVRTPGLTTQVPQSTEFLLLPQRGARPSAVLLFYHEIEGSLHLAYSPSFPYSDWKIQRIFGTPTVGDEDMGQYISAAGQGSELLHLAFMVTDHRGRRYLAYNAYSLNATAPGAPLEIVDQEGLVGEFASLVLDRSLRPSISYYDSTNNDLKLAVRADQNRWLIYRPDLVGVVGDNCRMRLLPDGQLGITYRDQTRGALKFTVVLAE